VHKKKVLVMSTLLVAIVLLGIGTIAYFRRTVNGNLAGQTGNLVLIVNEANAVQNQSFSVSLNRSEEEPFVLPDDKGSFNINIDSTGSSSDVDVTITITRTNLPDNLKFYLDSAYTEELTTTTYVIKKSNDMTMAVPVYWFWDGSVDDENDTLFMGKTLEANVSVTATVAVPPTLLETLLAQSYTLDTNVDFSQGASETNGQGLMMVSSTQNENYPVLYYRGDVTNNNVIYAGFCWLIVRTTETGGIKLIYNGVVNDDGSCNNYSGVGGEPANSDYEGAYINRATVVFNEVDGSPVYVGYMYNDTNKFYASYTLDATGYIAHLSDNTIDSTTGRHTQNLKDSTIKGVIDAWYVSNIDGKSEENLLEDTVWCADRSVTSTNFSIMNYATDDMFMYSAGTRLGAESLFDESIISTIEPSLSCTRDMDRFTVDSTNGNGDLNYPISMLTADEIALAGNVYIVDGDLITTYLTLPNGVWVLSPRSFRYGYAISFFLQQVGLVSNNVNLSGGVRPSVSLGLGAHVTGGNGSFETPYIVG